MKKKTAELVAGAIDAREKVRRIYAYVQGLYQRFRKRADLENWYTRYIDSVDELISLDQIDSTIIQEADFHYLFVAMVRAAGLECHTVFHPMRTEFPFQPEMVSEDFVDCWTIAVKVDGNWVLYQPITEVPLSAGTLSWAIEGQPALMAMPQQQVFLKVPPATAESSTAETRAKFELDMEGNLQGECVRTLTGHFAQMVRIWLRETGQEEWWRLARSLLDLENPSAELRLHEIEGLDNPDEPVRIHASIRWPAYAPMVNDQMVFPLAVWREGQPPLLNELKRTTPVFFEFPRVETESITIHLPGGYRPRFLPKAITAQSGDFAYALSTTQDSEHGLLTVERSSTNRSIEIPVKGYARARDWFRRVSVADQIGVTLARPTNPSLK